MEGWRVESIPYTRKAKRGPRKPKEKQLRSASWKSLTMENDHRQGYVHALVTVFASM